MTEQRPIDANALKMSLMKWFPAYTLEGLDADVLFRQIIRDIDNAPTIAPKEIPVAKIEFSREQMQEIVDEAVRKICEANNLKEEVKNTTVAKGCSTCKYETNLIPEEPCFSCIHGLCDENPNRRENWEAKDE